MANMKWTQEQQAAIEIRNADTLVSAAAGSGKTAVLVERVIRMVTDSDHPVDVDRLLVVTFTNAAARQMKQKIGAALVREIEAHPEDARPRRQLTLLGNAGIDTMHAFCKRLIQQNFQKTNLPYDFRIADEVEAKMLRQDAVEEAFGALYESCGDRMELLAEWYGGRDDTPLTDLVLQLYEFARSIPFYREWLERKAQMPGDSILDTVWGRYLKSYAIDQLEQALQMIDHAAARLAGLDEGQGLENLSITFAQDRELISDLLSKTKALGWDDLFQLFSACRFAPIKRVKKGGNTDLGEEFKKTRQYVKDIVGVIAHQIFFQPEYACLEDVKKAGEQLQFLIAIVLQFEDVYAEKKRQKSVVDFGDLEHFSIAVLCQRDEDGTVHPSPEALQLQQQYYEVLIDEYQDTNDVQELIFSMAAGAGKRFMVGDLKQSIYSFRNSKPALFLEKYEHYGTKEGDPQRRLLLSKNFRSSREVLSCCNFVFSRMMCKACGGLDYGAEEALVFGGGYPEGNLETELYLCDRASDSEEDEPAQMREALLCARRIRELVLGQTLIYDSEAGQMRPCRYGDITVLLRSVTSRSEYYTEAFSRYEIPYELDKGSSFFEAQEVKLAIALLQIIDNPRQDIPLLAVLRSPMFDWTDDALTQLRVHGTGDYYDCLCQSAAQGVEQSAAFLQQLEHWREQADFLRVGKLLEYLYEETGLLLYYSHRPDGELRRSRLQLLIQWAGSFEQTSYHGLFHFVTYLRRQMEELAEEGVSMSDSTSHQDAVTLMSIHKSKGLEAEIIFLCDCGKRFNQTDLARRLLMDEALGLGSDCVDTEHHLVYDTFCKKAIKLKKKQELLAEELRLLYVAMTRARQKLVIIGSLRKPKEHLAGLRGLVTGAGFETAASLSANCYLDWFLPAFLFHPSAAEFRSYGLGWEDQPGFALKIVCDEENKDTVEPEETPKPAATLKARLDLSPLDWEYPYRALSNIPAKLSVTEMKRIYEGEPTEEGWVFYPREQEEMPLPERPAFLMQETLTAAQKGTAYHTAMQYFPLECFKNQNDAEQMLDLLVSQGRMTATEREAVDSALLCRFGDTHLFRLLCRAEKIHREQRFLLRYPAKHLFSEAGEEDLLVQGMIDCLAKVDGEYYLLDYKTDRTAENCRDRYGMQLHFYALAVEQIYGKKPKESWLYFIRTGEEISL